MDIQDGWTPGKGYVAGYFFPLDEASTRLFDFSNEREIFYLDIYPGDPSREDYMGILAHEFQHMIHANHDRRETRWLNEALAQIAFFVNGYGHAPQTFSFARSSDTSLIEFDNGLDDYGSVYLWTYYLLTKYAGDDPAAQAAFTRALVASQEKGMVAFDEVLASIGAPSAAEIFQDWVIANAANAPSILSGKYGYDASLPFRVQPTTVHSLDGRTGKVKTDVHPWGADTITFVPEVLYSPLNPTMADRVTLLAKDGAEELAWTINGGQVPPQALLPEGSRIEDGRAVSPVVASDPGLLPRQAHRHRGGLGRRLLHPLRRQDRRAHPHRPRLPQRRPRGDPGGGRALRAREPRGRREAHLRRGREPGREEAQAPQVLVQGLRRPRGGRRPGRRCDTPTRDRR